MISLHYLFVRLPFSPLQNITNSAVEILIHMPFTSQISLILPVRLSIHLMYTFIIPGLTLFLLYPWHFVLNCSSLCIYISFILSVACGWRLCIEHIHTLITLRMVVIAFNFYWNSVLHWADQLSSITNWIIFILPLESD